MTFHRLDAAPCDGYRWTSIQGLRGEGGRQTSASGAAGRPANFKEFIGVQGGQEAGAWRATSGTLTKRRSTTSGRGQQNDAVQIADRRFLYSFFFLTAA